MDVLLLGAAAILLLVLTIWIVWRPGSGEAAANTEDAGIPPQGDQFEDQYTSATADLSAGGVAVATAAESAAQTDEPGSQADTSFATSETPWPQDTPRSTGSATGDISTEWPREDDVRRGMPARRTVGVGAAALLTVAGAIAGAWLYARVQRERNKPLNRLRRRFR